MVTDLIFFTASVGSFSVYLSATYLFFISLNSGLAVERNARKQKYLVNLTGDQLGFFERAGAKMEEFLEKQFFRWGHTCARNPFIVIVSCFFLANNALPAFVNY